MLSAIRLPDAVLAASRDTAINSVVLQAFALALSSATVNPTYPGVRGHEPALAMAKNQSAAVNTAIGEMRKSTLAPGSYMSESDYSIPSAVAPIGRTLREAYQDQVDGRSKWSVHGSPRRRQRGWEFRWV